MSELVLQEPTFALSSTDAIDLLLAGCEYHDTFDFPGTSIQVVLMTANKE